MSLEVTIRKKLASFTLDVEFSAEGGVFALLGSSGCGKSMTLKCIAGIERPDEGRIVLHDRVLFDAAKGIDLSPQKRRVGYMFQDYALFPNMTVAENVAAGLMPEKAGGSFLRRRRGRGRDGRKEAEIWDLLRRFHIEELAERRPDRLSGGQKQRVAMARIMAQAPDVILLDEPFSALDSYLKWQLEQEMKNSLEGIGRPVLFVSHSRDEVYHLADTVCCMKEGSTEVIAPVREFFENPGTRTACILSGCKNVSSVRVLDSHHLQAVEWGIPIAVRREIPPGIAAVGIRAHAFAETAKERYDNSVAVMEPTVLEDLFEWTVSFRGAPGGGLIQWKVPKEEMTGTSALTVPGRLSFDSRDVMLLKD